MILQQPEPHPHPYTQPHPHTPHTSLSPHTGGVDFAPLNAILLLDSSTGTLTSCTIISVFPDDLLESRETFTVSGTADIVSAGGVNTVMVLGPVTVNLLDNTGTYILYAACFVVQLNDLI